jgi:hypothetical protein
MSNKTSSLARLPRYRAAKSKRERPFTLSLVLVAITLVMMWYLTQATFGVMTVRLPSLVAPTPTHIVHHKSK